ncbi:MAG: helix-turn-helix domain-containing protein [Candidatus Nanopelagicales bacterium]|nr:helix-turn-helix domain-containing protein [Candidatus Nanopelagicales bacterium]
MNSVEHPSSECRQAIAQRLTEARERMGISPVELAEKLRLRESFILAVESGRGGQHMEWAYERIHVRSIARILNVELTDLVEFSSHE